MRSLLRKIIIGAVLLDEWKHVCNRYDVSTMTMLGKECTR